MIPACSDATVQQLRDLHPERSLDLNLENLPTPESLIISGMARMASL
jgi:hypothetical protein